MRIEMMRLGAVLLMSFSLIACEQGHAVKHTTLDSQALTATINQVAQWSLDNPASFDPRSWVMAPLYEGLIDASLATGDPRYLAAVIRAGRRSSFATGSRTYHADGHATGRAWLRLHQLDPAKNPQFFDPFRELFDRIVANPIRADLRFGRRPPDGLRVTDRWSWADALYMSPPTIVVLAQTTADTRYLDFMDAEFRFTYEQLYDRTDHLFYRDARYIDPRTANGEKVFWSRGNGWVYAGLALVLDRLPADRASRPFYVIRFQEMSEALRALQQPDGFWYPSLKDPREAPTPETSGTAFFVLGMATGVRLGLLDPAVYWPVIERAWSALRGVIDQDGAVNFVQPIGESPEQFDPQSRVPYGTGAVLGAAWAIQQALGGSSPVDSAALFIEAEQLAATAPDLSSVCEDPCVTPIPAESR